MTTPKFTDKAQFLAHMQLGSRFWHTPLSFGRIENGIVDFNARKGDKLYVVCIKLETLEEFMELDISEVETLESFSYADQLYVAIRDLHKCDASDEVLFDSFKQPSEE